MEFKNLITIVLVLIVIFSCELTNCKTKPDPREEISSKEKIALEKFRKEIKNLQYLDYHNKDFYLLHWLRDQNLDITKAKEKFVKSLEWRKENQIDSIRENSEMKALEKVLPYSAGKYFDKFGRPTLYATFADWSIRTFTLKGKRDLVNRYMVYIFETMMKAARDVGRDHFIWFIDMNGYNLKDQGCLACLPFYTTLVTEYENHFPNTARHIILINTPRIFETALNLMKPLMSQITRMDLEVIGTNKLEWRTRILELFDSDALPPKLGGTGHF